MKVEKIVLPSLIVLFLAGANAAAADCPETATSPAAEPKDPDAIAEAPAPEIAEEKPIPRDRRVLSALAPSPGKGALSIGVAFYLQIPTLDIKYVRSFDEHWSLDAAVATLAVTQAARAGARYRIAGDAESSIAVRASLIELHSLTDEPRVIFGAGPGVIVSFGDESVQWTGSFDFGIALFDSAPFSTAGEGFEVRPAFGVEVPIADSLNVMGEAAMVMTLDSTGVLVIPVFTAGIAW